MADSPRPWLRPLIAGVTAVILGVTGAIVGAQFAAPEIVESAPTTVTAPVVAPVAIGESAVYAEPDPNAETVVLSQGIAEREVMLPTSLGAASDAPSELFAALAEADDPLAELALFEERSGTGDDCAPVSGEVPEGCPDGRRSTILPLVSPPELHVYAIARFPRPDSWTNPKCPSLDLGSGRVNIDIGTTAPVSELSFSYFVTSEGGRSAMSADPIATSAEERRLFDERLAAATSSYGLPLIGHCKELTGLANDTPYTLEVQAIDVFGREADSTIYFNTSGLPQRPGAQVIGVLDNYVFASALHPASERAEIRGWIVPPDTAPSCESPAGPEHLGVVEETETTVTGAYLNEINAPQGFEQKTSWWFRVPEGSTVFFCVRWFDIRGDWSWERTQPVYQSEAILQSPDRNIPVLTINRTAVSGRSIGAVYLDVATSEGVRCGSVALYQRTSGVSGPIEPCARDILDGGQRWEPLDVYESSVGGDLVLTFTTELTNGRSAVETVIIPASNRACVGTCDLPPVSRYEFALPAGSFVNHTGLCGSGIGGSCPPRVRTSFGGTVTAILEWERGRTNGVQVWADPTPVHTDLSATPADVPQFNTDNRLILLPYNFESLIHRAYFRLEVDRPVTYTARLIDPWGGEPCVRADGVIEVSGTAGPDDRPQPRVEFTGLCFGTSYSAEVELVDDSGARSTWSTLNLATRWAASSITVPRLDVEISYGWVAESEPFSAIPSLVVLIDGEELGAIPRAFNGEVRRIGDELDRPTAPTGDPRCSVSGEFDAGRVVRPVKLSENPTLTLDASIVRLARPWRVEDCLSRPYLRSLTTPQLAHLQLKDLLAGTVILEFRDGDTVQRMFIRTREVWVPPTG